MLELLAAVCLVRGGHDIILSAFDNFKEVMEPPPNMYLLGALLLVGVPLLGQLEMLGRYLGGGFLI